MIKTTLLVIRTERLKNSYIGVLGIRLIGISRVKADPMTSCIRKYKERRKIIIIEKRKRKNHQSRRKLTTFEL
jgi:hypothetical protein